LRNDCDIEGITYAERQQLSCRTSLKRRKKTILLSLEIIKILFYDTDTNYACLEATRASIIASAENGGTGKFILPANAKRFY